MALAFYKCAKCGNVAVKPYDSGAPLSCCGQKMEELTANTVDAAKEKHVPMVTVNGPQIDVVVGEVEHPMLEEHYITFICLETQKGYQFAPLKPGMKPAASFVVADDDAPVAVYEYCNLHGLWKAEL